MSIFEIMKKIVVFTGAGISQESGLKTFRDEDGLWENYDIEDVATIEAWHRNPALVLEFYNIRRDMTLAAKPNKAHKLLEALEKYYDVEIITQNIDNLHERAGSSKITHLHGMIDMAKSEITGIQKELNGAHIQLGDTCVDGHQLRPDIVWFGEDVPQIEVAAEICKKADIFIVVGTSLNVYPAAGLVHVTPSNVPKFIIDPNLEKVNNLKKVTYIKEKATVGMEVVFDMLVNKSKRL